jgi:aminoglycoside 6'-N-acetyltransferase I
MIVRPAIAADFPAWAAMRRRLWPDCEPSELEAEPPAFGLVAEAEGRLIGFAEASVRNYAEGAPPGPAAYLEGIWVEPEHRRRGVARALLAAVEAWARRQGLAHLGSDALLDNELSHRWHGAAGFGEVERLVVFGKSLR